MLQIKNTLGGGKPEGLYVWSKNIDYAKVQAITLPGYYDNGSASDKSKTSYIGNFSTTPVVYSSGTFSIDDDTGMFILTGNIREYTPSSSSSSNYFNIHKQYIMFGTTTGNCMWTGIASDCYGWLYWDSNNDYWLLNRYSQTGLAKVIALRAKGSSTTDATNVTLKSSGNIYYSNSIVTDTSGNISLSGTISSLAYSSSNVSIPAGKFFMIESKSSDLAFFSSLNDSYPTIVSPSYGRVEADSPSYAYIVINKSTVKKTVSFVVSDKETAYPDGGVHTDGYYYEKVGGGITPEMFGCTKMEASTFTLASRTSVGSYTITHSLGVKPRAIVVLAIDELTVNDDVETFVGVTRLGNTQSGQVHFYHSTGNYYSDSNYAKGFNSIDENTAVLSASYRYFGAGIKYGVLAMA